jgi:hypothetical protein
VGEGLVGLGHLVRVFLLLHRVAAVVRGVHDLAGELLHHGLLATIAAVLDDPAHREGHAAVLTDFDGNLVGRATDAAALHLEHGLDVVEGALEDLERLFLRALRRRSKAP